MKATATTSSNLFLCSYYQALAEHLSKPIGFRLSCWKFHKWNNAQYYPRGSQLLKQATFNDVIKANGMTW